MSNNNNNNKKFVLMSDKEKKDIHRLEQVRYQKPKGTAFSIGEYVSLDKKTMIVYNRDCRRFNPTELYGFVSYDEVFNNEDRDFIWIVRFSNIEKDPYFTDKKKTNDFLGI